MLGIELMTEAARRYGSGPGWAAVVSDAFDQSHHRMDAPDTVHDGMEWLADHDDPEFCGPAARVVPLREQPNVEVTGAPPTDASKGDDA